MKLTYHEQKKYPATNWANEVSALRTKYQLDETEDEIITLTKQKWKEIVKSKVRQYAFIELKKEAETQKHALDVSAYADLNKQSYITELSPARARKIFHIRTNTIDLRTIRKYQHGDSTKCRLCDTEDETLAHVVNRCPNIPRETLIPNLYCSDSNLLQEIADRCVNFMERTKEKDDNNVDGLVQV